MKPSKWEQLKACILRRRRRMADAVRFQKNEQHQVESLGMTLDQYRELLRQKASKSEEPEPLPGDSQVTGMLAALVLLGCLCLVSFEWGRSTEKERLDRIEQKLDRKADIPPPGRLSAW